MRLSGALFLVVVNHSVLMLFDKDMPRPGGVFFQPVAKVLAPATIVGNSSPDRNIGPPSRAAAITFLFVHVSFLSFHIRH